MYLLDNGSQGRVIAFYAYASRFQTLYPLQPFMFDLVETNVCNGFNVQDSKFTAPARGLYYFAANIMARPGHYIHIDVVKNGRRISSLFAGKSGITYNSMTGNAIMNIVLDAGDCVWVRHQANYEREAVVSAPYAMFSGYLITQNV